MNRLRTSLAAAAVGAAALTTGVLASSADATPATVTAVDAVTPGSAAIAGTVSSSEAAQGVRLHATRTWWKKLTDEQRACLTDADIRRPVGRLDDAEKAALREKVTAAAATCAIELPGTRAREFRAGLSEKQKQCLEDAALTRPWGPLSKEQRQQLRADRAAAAKECDVTLPSPS